MKKLQNSFATTEQVLNGLQKVFAKYYADALLRNVKAGIRAKKLKLLCQAK